MKRVKELIFGDNSQLRLITGVGAFVLSLGFMFSTTDNPNYQIINTVASKILWGILFLIHSFKLFYSSYFPIDQRIIKQSMSITGIMLWGSVFASFVLFDPTPIASTEWLLLLPFFVEVWLLIATFKNDDRS